MVVGCPKCRAKLKIPEEKIKPEGTKFKCPKCQAMLLVKRPAAKAAAPPPPPKAKAPAEAHHPFEAPPREAPMEKPEAPFERPEPPSERMEWPAPPEEEPPAEREPWLDFPPTPSAEREPWPEMPPEPPAGPEIPEEPEAPAPPPPHPFEEEPAPPSAPPTFEEPLAPPKMEPAVEAPAPPMEPPVEEAARKAPSAVEEEAVPEARKVLLAHPNPQTVNMLKFVLMGANFSVASATDGVQAMVKALKEMPAVIVADVRLPKIHGIEMMKRLRSRAETKDIGIILTGSKPEAEVPRIPGVAGYIQEDRMQQGLVALIRKALAAPPAPPRAAPAVARPAAVAPRPAAAPPSDAGAQRAQRFARTVLSDIDLYNKVKVEQSIRQGNFEDAFSKELQEGRKLYEMRIPEDVRRKGNFFDDAVRDFIEKKKDQFGI